ncbi:MAG: TrmH family RNA methyltransferase, partial [Patescibacteria group bacterium]
QLKKQNYQIIGVEITNTSIPYTTANYQEKVALVFGSEPTKGLTEDVLSLCDITVHVPMRGQKNSLNVAVVGGIVIYHLLND